MSFSISSSLRITCGIHTESVLCGIVVDIINLQKVLILLNIDLLIKTLKRHLVVDSHHYLIEGELLAVKLLWNNLRCINLACYLRLRLLIPIYGIVRVSSRIILDS